MPQMKYHNMCKNQTHSFFVKHCSSLISSAYSLQKRIICTNVKKLRGITSCFSLEQKKVPTGYRTQHLHDVTENYIFEHDTQ